jgi:HAE1 family hydrophobic/amphiphilic exporter-1
MWLTRVSILRPVTITMVVLAILVLGIVAWSRLPVDLYPDIEFPFVTVVSVYPGTGPQEIETLVTKPIEDALSTISGVKNVQSTSQEGVSTVGIEFYLGTDLDTAANDVREKMDSLRGRLPSDMDPPVIQKIAVQSLPVVAFALSSPRPAKELRRLADDVVKDRMGRLRGVGSVRISGGDVREILVAAHGGRLESYGLTISEVVQALQAANLNLPSGSVKEERREYAVRAVGEFQSPDELRDVQLRTRAGETVPLSQIAEISDTVAERRAWTRVNGQDSVAVTVLKQSDANTVQVADAVRAELMNLTGQTFNELGEEVKEAPRRAGVLPSDITAGVTFDSSTFIRDALHDLQTHLIIGALLAVSVVFLFLHNIRGTIIVALAIPTSIVATFTPMYFAGFSLNQMTMLGLALSVGILVDDSIVVIENIYRHLRMGEEPREAAFNGRTEIGLAAITITLSDVVVFVPIAFMGGITGMFFRQFGLTVAIATLFSLFVSFTLTPMLSSRWYRKEDAVPSEGSESEGTLGRGRMAATFDRWYGNLDRGYRKVLAWALDHRLATVLIGVITLLGSVGIAASDVMLRGLQVVMGLLIAAGLLWGGAGGRRAMVVVGIGCLLVPTLFHAKLGSEFFPRVDQGQVSVNVELPAGSSLKATDEVVRELEDRILDRERFPEVESVLATVGEGVSGFFGGAQTGASYGGLTVTLVDKLKRERSDTEVVAEIDKFAKSIPGADIKTTAYQGMGGGGTPINIEISGGETPELVSAAEKVRAVVAGVPGTRNADISWKVGKPEVRADIDRYRAADQGVSTFQAASAVRASLEGDTSTMYREGGNQYDIRVRLREVDRESVQEVSRLLVGYHSGPVYLGDIASVSLASGPTKIDRKNRQRIVAVQADLEGGYAQGNVVREIQRQLEEVDPGRVSLYYAGESEMMREGFGSAGTALVLSVVLIYILMAALFEGYLSPLIIMFGLPMALVGALLAIIITGKTLSIVTIIGIIMLMGLVNKNAILLVDYTNTLRGRGKGRREALLEAGPTRLRPILMTTLSMVFGMLPIALAVSRGGEIRSPMAVAVIGGLILSTMLTLLVIPVLYTVFDSMATSFNSALRRVLGRLLP